MGSGPDLFLAECAELVRAGQQLVLVHGGGPQIDAAVRRAGVAERRIAGLRVTDAATLEITEAVLCGTVNKALVRAFGASGVQAIGLSGQDAGLLIAGPLVLADHETTSGDVAFAPGAGSLGFVGEVLAVNPEPIFALLAAGYLPVIAPLGCSADRQFRYNLNADTAAGALAGALGADPYIVITDVPRVRRDPHDASTGIDRLSLSEARVLLEAGAFDGGMRPKMLAIMSALMGGASRAVLAGGERALHKALTGDGTVIYAD